MERKRILKAYGAEMVFTDPGEGSDGAIRRCREIYEADPDKYFYPDQYNNPANWKAHFETTGPEIMEQTAGPNHAFRRRHGYQRHIHRGNAPLAAGHARCEVLFRAACRGHFTGWKD